MKTIYKNDGYKVIYFGFHSKTAKLYGIFRKDERYPSKTKLCAESKSQFVAIDKANELLEKEN
jgi:hypothetical protein